MWYPCCWTIVSTGRINILKQILKICRGILRRANIPPSRLRCVGGGRGAGRRGQMRSLQALHEAHELAGSRRRRRRAGEDDRGRRRGRGRGRGTTEERQGKQREAAAEPRRRLRSPRARRQYLRFRARVGGVERRDVLCSREGAVPGGRAAGSAETIVDANTYWGRWRRRRRRRRRQGRDC